MKLQRIFAAFAMLALFLVITPSFGQTIKLGKTTLDEAQKIFSAVEGVELKEAGVLPVTPNTKVYGFYKAGKIISHMVFQNGLYVMKQGPVWTPSYFAQIENYIKEKGGRQKDYLGLHVKVCFDNPNLVARAVYLFTQEKYKDRPSSRWVHLIVERNFLMDFLSRQPDPAAQVIWAPPLFIYDYWSK